MTEPEEDPERWQVREFAVWLSEFGGVELLLVTLDFDLNLLVSEDMRNMLIDALLDPDRPTGGRDGGD